jgi:hypothetical protein
MTTDEIESYLWVDDQIMEREIKFKEEVNFN